MPAKSQAQRRLMCAAEAGKVKGISKAVGKEYCHTKGKLPQKVKRK